MIQPKSCLIFNSITSFSKMSTLQNLRLQSLASIIIIFQLLLIQKDLKLTWTKILHFLPNKNVPGISKTEFLKKDNFKQECLAIPHSNHLSSSDFLRACEHRSMWLNYQKELSTNASVKNFFTGQFTHIMVIDYKKI